MTGTDDVTAIAARAAAQWKEALSAMEPNDGPIPTPEERRAALRITDQPAAARLLGQVRNQVPPRDGSGIPTADQVALVLHALADYTAVQHMLGDRVRVLGLGGAWPNSDDRAHVVCRYFQAVADSMQLAEWGDLEVLRAKQKHDAVVDYERPRRAE